MSCVRYDHLLRSQFGEDRVLWNVFRRRPSGYFIEVGAYDGVTLSNTYFLEQMGWSGLLVEPIPAFAQRATLFRARSRVIQAACSRTGCAPVARFTVAQNVPVLSFLKADAQHAQRCLDEGAQLVEIDVPIRTLNDLLLAERAQQSGGPGPWAAGGGWSIDLVSIDTEGCELDVLDGFDLDRFRPTVLVIENDRPAGAEIEPYLSQRGYRKFHRQQINDFYVRAASAESDELELVEFNSPF